MKPDRDWLPQISCRPRRVILSGGNHLLVTIRRNINLALLAHNNQVYALTKGQASPTPDEGQVTKVQPQKVPSVPFNPIAAAVARQAGFVARIFSGMTDHLTRLIQQAITPKGEENEEICLRSLRVCL